MKLLIRQKVFSWTDKFIVTDEVDTPRYTVEGEVFSFGKKLHICDMMGNEVAYIEQKVWSWLPRYRVFVGDTLIGEVVREVTFFRPRYTVEGPGWDVEGDFWAHDYTVRRHGVPVVSIAKEWFTWGDCYALSIYDPLDEIQALALVLAIDCASDGNDSN